MKRYLVTLSCAVLLLASWIATEAHAQTRGRTAAQSHLAAAKAAGYEPGNDLTVLYDTVCEPALSEKGPVQPNIQGGPGDAGNGGGARIPQRSAWYAEPTKVFDNLYYVGEIRQSTWA